jgi:hypothetical protein
VSECKKCGRGDGHYIGCAAVSKYQWADHDKQDPAGAGLKAMLGCSFPDCTEPRKSADKRVKFCEFHSDPKNRK